VLRGMNQPEIAKKLNVSLGTVKKDLVSIRGAWLKEAVMTLDNAKAKALARIEQICKEAWAGWERSCQPAEVEKTSTEQIPAGEEFAEGRIKQLFRQKLKAERRKEGQAGDPRFLAVLDSLLDRICRIQGLYAAVKHAHGGDDDAPPIRTKTTVDWSLATVEEIEWLRELGQRIARRAELDDGKQTFAAAPAPVDATQATDTPAETPAAPPSPPPGALLLPPPTRNGSANSNGSVNGNGHHAP
jgi:hypothetical protein